LNNLKIFAIDDSAAQAVTGKAGALTPTNGHLTGCQIGDKAGNKKGDMRSQLPSSCIYSFFNNIYTAHCSGNRNTYTVTIAE
jgi:hypothetical protein